MQADLLEVAAPLEPGMPRSRTNSDIPLWRWVGSVFTAVITRSALMPLVMNVFEPLTT